MVGSLQIRETLRAAWLYAFCIDKSVERHVNLLPVGNPTDADCIFVQAFGRVSYPDTALPEIMRWLRKEADDTDLHMFELLDKYCCLTGASNQALAVTCYWLIHENPNLHLMMQWEVALELWRIDHEWYVYRLQQLHTIWPPGDGYFDTTAVKRVSIGLMRYHGLSRPLELAKSAMLVRAWLIIRRLGVEPRLVIANIPFDENSIQPWTRNRRRWIARELLGRVHHVLTRRVRFTPN